MAKAQISIRTARTEDLNDLVGLLHMLFSIEKDFLFDVEKQKKGLSTLLDTEQAVVLVADAEGKAVGMCTGQIVVSTAEGGPSVLVEDVTVAKEFQGQGIGKKLMSEIESWARKRGATRLQLLADQHNTAAISFYEKIGWTGTNLICLRRKEQGPSTN